MTPLVPERSLMFSPALAATIGLEEAILLHLLHDLASCSARSDAPWHDIEHSVLSRLAPFWELRDLQRVVKNLADKGIVAIEPPQHNIARLRFSFLSIPGAAVEQRPVREHEHSAAPQASPQTARRAESTRSPAAAYSPARYSREELPQTTNTRGGATRLTQDWRPSEDLLQLLGLNHGISRGFALAQLEDFIIYWCERNEVDHAWSSRFRQHVLRQWRHEQQNANAKPPARQAPQNDWYPSDDALQILERSGVNRAFIEDAIPEFVLYWRERGEANGTWNSKFIAHIRRQWASFTHALEHEREPHPIPANWRPSEDVYDILRMANIDVQFAEQQIPEFILFWRDTGTAQRSWNTKFLQHAKYQWAARHQLPGAKAAATSSSSTFDQLTDRSWATGLISGA